MSEMVHEGMWRVVKGVRFRTHPPGGRAFVRETGRWAKIALALEEASKMLPRSERGFHLALMELYVEAEVQRRRAASGYREAEQMELQL